jgi:hypothetical protein
MKREAVSYYVAVRVKDIEYRSPPYSTEAQARRIYQREIARGALEANLRRVSSCGTFTLYLDSHDARPPLTPEEKLALLALWAATPIPRKRGIIPNMIPWESRPENKAHKKAYMAAWRALPQVKVYEGAYRAVPENRERDNALRKLRHLRAKAGRSAT